MFDTCPAANQVKGGKGGISSAYAAREISKTLCFLTSTKQSVLFTCIQENSRANQYLRLADRPIYMRRSGRANGKTPDVTSDGTMRECHNAKNE